MVSRSTSLRCEEVAQGQYCTGESKYALQGTPDRPHLPPRPPSSSALRERKGGIMPPAPSPLPRPLPQGERKRGDGSGAVATLRLCLTTMPRPQSPLSRSAGEGLGVRAARTFPLAPSPHTLGAEEGGWERSSGNSAPVSYNDAAATITPLPQRGRGAGGEGRRSAGEGLGVRVAAAHS